MSFRDQKYNTSIHFEITALHYIKIISTTIIIFALYISHDYFDYRDL
jgi:hypothetical protein